MTYLKIVSLFLAFLFLLQTVQGQARKPGCEKLDDNLAILAKRSGNENLALMHLFNVGDACIDDLVRTLNGEKFELSVAAQEVIRYLGNETGVKALDDWNRQNKRSYPIWGPVPVPIMDFDYEMIDVNLANDQKLTPGLLTGKYLFALAIDKTTEKSAKLLAELCRGFNSGSVKSRGNIIAEHICLKNSIKSFREGTSLEKAVLDHAFFINPNDIKVTHSKLLSFNSDRSKALLELVISRGFLAEEWHHVVVRRVGDSWVFYSITFIKQS